jgi:hypothetical protein
MTPYPKSAAAVCVVVFAMALAGCGDKKTDLAGTDDKKSADDLAKEKVAMATKGALRGLRAYANAQDVHMSMHKTYGKMSELEGIDPLIVKANSAEGESSYSGFWFDDKLPGTNLKVSFICVLTPKSKEFGDTIYVADTSGTIFFKKVETIPDHGLKGYILPQELNDVKTWSRVED